MSDFMGWAVGFVAACLIGGWIAWHMGENHAYQSCQHVPPHYWCSKETAKP